MGLPVNNNRLPADDSLLIYNMNIYVYLQLYKPTGTGAVQEPL